MISRHLSSIACIISLLLAGGCTKLGPDFKTPDAPVPSAWIEQDSNLFSRPSQEDSIVWWHQFKDPRLDRLIKMSFDQNLNLQTAALRIIEARAQLAYVRGTVYPQVQQAQGALTTNGGKESVNPRYYNAASLGFDVGWEMDFWGKYARNIESADAAYLASIADYDDMLVSLSAEVARVYIDICTLEERIRLARKNVKIQESGLKLVQDQFDAGTVTELDLMQAQTLLASTQASIPALKSGLAANRHALAVLLGLLPKELDNVLQETHGVPSLSTEIGVGAPAELLRRRPDIRRAEMMAAAQSARIGVARADLFPSFTLFGSLSLSAIDAGSGSLSDTFNIDNASYGFGPSFTWNLFNYDRLKNIVRIQDARFQQLIAAYRNTVLSAAREVEDGLTRYLYSRQEAEFIHKAIATSGKSLQLSLLQYEEGFVDYQRVLDSTRSLTQKQDQYAQLQGQIATSAVALYKAMGGGWQPRSKNGAHLPADVRKEMEDRTDWGGLLEQTPGKQQ
jgi:NodT family efflux transporter outer membrane factor (OMF) lipoprotein